MEGVLDKTVMIPISTKLYNEVVLRSRGRMDVSHLAENQIEFFLEDTIGDASIWGEEHAEQHWDDKASEQWATFGDPSKSYAWQTLRLPNGTKLKMKYQGADHHAEIRHQKLVFDGEKMSPSVFASRVANNTARNAWRDIQVMRPDDSDWELADVMRRNPTG